MPGRTRFIPLRYPLRSLRVRWSPSLFSAIGIGFTIAVFAAVLALRDGFGTVMGATGADDVLVYLRQGSRAEGDSVVRHPAESAVLRSRPEIALAADGTPMAAVEASLGARLPRLDGTGLGVVTVRGVEPASFAIQGPRLRIVDGRLPAFGTDEVVAGRSLSRRIRGCVVGGTIEINLTTFRVVGLFEHEGAYASEIWGDVERITAATDRPARQRVIARRGAHVDVAALRTTLEADRRTPMTVQTEREHFAAQASRLSRTLGFLALVLAVLMGGAATIGAINTMVAAVGARTREVGVLAALGFSRRAIFLSFLVEGAALGLVGGLVGCLVVLPLHGMETATMNWNTFAEVGFAFRVTPALVADAFALAVTLGLCGGAAPAWRASRILPTAALRRL